MTKRRVVAVDQSTSASKVFLLDECGEIVRRFSKAHQQTYPHPGWVEHDAEEIWRNVREGIASVTQGLDRNVVCALGISNQRETTVLWSRKTSKPLCPAVVWQDVRGAALVRELHKAAPWVKERTGLTLSAYYPAAKAAAVLREHPEFRGDDLCIGTVDAWLIFCLTEGRSFMTDVSNASRTQLMDLRTLQWDAELCELFGIPLGALPRIVPSDACFGVTETGIPIQAALGDSHAAFFAQGCDRRGTSKATYGTGSSVMIHTGEAPVASSNGLSASVGYGCDGQTCYVLEGNVTCSGDTLVWLRDQCGLISGAAEAESLAAETTDPKGVYFVPAFSGLGAPYFDSGAKALLYGMNRGTTRAHIVRAALESIAFQNADILAAARADLGEKPTELRTDGGPSGDAVLMQLQADLCDCEIRCAPEIELSALGAGRMAGRAAGIYPRNLSSMRKTGNCYLPIMDPAEREKKLSGWQDAVRRARSDV